MSRYLRPRFRHLQETGGLLVIFVTVTFFTPSTSAQITVPGADGSDGALNITANTTIDLTQAIAGNWDAASTQPGKGIYDSTKWAVVFKYTSVNIASGATLTFKNNASRAPVVWLVSGNVTITGSINIVGGESGSLAPAEPGPGGFRGGFPHAGTTALAGSGFGPGGGRNFEGSWGRNGAGGSYNALGAGAVAPRVYGNPLNIPLLGGSGGGGNYNGARPGGSGGGAILIAAQGSVTISGSINARGGGTSMQAGGGSGGAIRIIATSLAGAGVLEARGGYESNFGADGRIRLEALSGGTTLIANPTTAVEPPASPVMLWPPETVASIRVVSVGPHPVPIDPVASLGPAPADIRFYSTAPLLVTIETKNVDVAASKVTLLVRPKFGDSVDVPAVYASGNTATATWTAEITVPQGFSAMQPRVDPM